MSQVSADRQPIHKDGGDEAVAQRMRSPRRDSSHSVFLSIVLVSLPTQASLGPLIPLAGPMWGFRATCLILAAYAMVAWRGRPSSGLQARLTAMLMLWGLTMGTWAIVSPPSSGGRAEIASVSTGLALVWAVGRIPEIGRSMRLLPLGWLVASIITGFIGFREFATGEHLSSYYLDEVAIRQYENPAYIASTFGNPNNYAFFLCCALPFLIVGMSQSQRHWKRGLFASGVGLALVSVFLTGSRIGLGVSLAEVMIALLALGVLRKASFFLLLALAVPLVLAMAPELRQTLGDRLDREAAVAIAPSETVFEELQGGAATSGGVRWNLMRNGWHFALDTALLGGGPGHFQARMREGGEPYPTAGIVDPHSGWIEILSQYGIFALLALVLLLVKVASIGFSAYRRFANAEPHDVRAYGLATGGLVTVLPVMSLMNSTFLRPATLWVALASVYLCATAMKGLLQGVDEKP